MSPGPTFRSTPLRIDLVPLASMMAPSVLAIAVPAVTIQRSAVVGCVSGGSPSSTIRTLALMLVGPLKRRELLRLRASLSFHLAWMSSLAQKAVLSAGKLGTATGAAPPGL